MARTLYKYLAAVIICCMSALMAGCDDNDMDKSNLRMDGEDFITSFSINGTEGTIDNINKTITVYLEPGTDITCLRPEFTLPAGATSDIPSGSTVDFTMPVVFKITNGNTFIDYTVTVRCFEALMTSFTITDASGNKYNGVINEANKTVEVYMPYGTDVTRLSATYSVSTGAEGTPASGGTYDFTNPVSFTVSGHGINNVYTVTVLLTDMPMTAFIGTAADVDGLKNEEKAAARWMLANIPRSVYISMQDLISGKVQLDPSECKAIWWHNDDDNWPSQGWDSREAIKQYYSKGGSLLLTRYACKYINDVYLISLDGREPNAQNKSETPAQLESPLGFVVDAADHPIFEGMGAVKDQPVYLIDQGFSTKNTQVDWNIWDYPNHSLEGWETATGAKRLAYESDDSNKTAIVEFPARTASAGRVILVGTGGYEWNVSNGENNQYAANRNLLTTNILRYLTGTN